MTDLGYIVLTDDNIDEVVERTNRPRELLLDLMANAHKYNHHVVLWHEFNTWFAIRIEKEFVKDGELDVVMSHILRRPH